MKAIFWPFLGWHLTKLCFLDKKLFLINGKPEIGVVDMNIRQKLCNHSKYPQYIFHEHQVGLIKDYEYMVCYKCGNCDRSAYEYTLDRKSLYKRLSEPQWRPNNKHAARLFYCLVPAMATGGALSLIDGVIGLIFGFAVFWLGMSVTE